MNRSAINALMTIALALAMISSAHAQATRTWVSGVGDDANPCSRTAPCKTFAGAISKTAEGGEISALDPGGFGAVTITKSITISGDGTLAGILAANINGVIINAGATDVVVLRSLSINGAGSGLNGIRYLAAGLVVVDNCSISGFTQNSIDMSLSGSGDLAVRNTSITGGTTGVRVSGTSGSANVTMHRVAIQNAATAVHALFGTVDVNDSMITQNSGVGVLAENGTINVANSMLSGNGTAVQSQTGSTIRLTNNEVFSNNTGFGCGGGTLASAGNNRKGGNVGGGVACAPNATVNVQ